MAESASRIAKGESMSDTFDCIRGDIYLYETFEIDYQTLLRGLRESIAVLEARETKDG